MKNCVITGVINSPHDRLLRTICSERITVSHCYMDTVLKIFMNHKIALHASNLSVPESNTHAWQEAISQRALSEREGTD